MKIILSDDLNFYQKKYFEELSKKISEDFIPSEEKAWFITNNWKKHASQFRLYPQVYISNLAEESEGYSLKNLLWKDWLEKPTTHANFLAHSPFGFRYLKEFKKRAKAYYWNLPYLSLEKAIAQPLSNTSYKIGVLLSLEETNHYPFFAQIAHYLTQRRQDVEFYVFNQGPLERHFKNILKALEIESYFHFMNEKIPTMDIYFYAPLRNYDFLPVYFSAEQKTPITCSSLPGIEEFILDANTGFLFENNHTKSAAELLLRLLDRKELKVGLGQQLHTHCKKNFEYLKQQDFIQDLFSLQRLKNKAAA
jgi:glycosyltransferase involved in cell wall biosynthesis